MSKKLRVIIKHINLNKTNYGITVLVKDELLREIENSYFTLEGRYFNAVINIHSENVCKSEDFTEFNIEIAFDEINSIISVYEQEIWDFYFNKELNGETEKLRVKSNYDFIRFNAIVIEENQKIFYPYTTKNGNISFRLNDLFVNSTLEKVELYKDSLSFEGFFNFPPMYKTDNYSVEKISLIIKNNISDEETEVNIERYNREDFYNKYEGNDYLKTIGIKGRFSLIPFIDQSQAVYLKCYIDLTYRHNGTLTKIRSPRIRMKNDMNDIIRKLQSFKGVKYKIRIKPTKKSKFLSVCVKKYNFKTEVINKIKTKLIRVRRSKKTKKLYVKVFRFVGMLPAKKNLIVFESFHGKQFSDSPRAIYEFIKENCPKYEMYWSVDKSKISFFKEKGLKVVRRYSLGWLFKMARAKYWVINNRLPLWVPKPNHTTYLQTWHGTPLKRLAADMDQVLMPGTNTKKYKKNFTTEAKRWDYLVSPNAYSTEIFKRAFQFEGNMIESGYPRNDFLINANEQEEILKLKRSMNIPLDKKVLLYAPTWRDNQFYSKGKYKFDIQLNLELLRKELGDKYVILLRLHYLVAENLDLNGYEGFVYDFSTYEDIRELYLVSDVLITDYSSVFFDYANLKRPMLFYVYDLEDYRDNLRGFYFDFEKNAPGPLVKTTEEIIQVVQEIENNGFTPSENIEAFYNKFCYLEDGEASKRVVEEVFKK